MIKSCLTFICLVVFVASNVFARSASLSSGQREVVGPDGHRYMLSQTNGDDIYGPMVVLVFNKPIGVVELSEGQRETFSMKVIESECASVKGKPSFDNVISDSGNPKIRRYEHKGQKRMAWSYIFHCVR